MIEVIKLIREKMYQFNDSEPQINRDNKKITKENLKLILFYYQIISKKKSRNISKIIKLKNNKEMRKIWLYTRLSKMSVLDFYNFNVSVFWKIAYPYPVPKNSISVYGGYAEIRKGKAIFFSKKCFKKKIKKNFRNKNLK